MHDSIPMDALEQRDAGQREAELVARLPSLLQQAKTSSGWARILADINPADISSRAALAQLPVTPKSSLKAMQLADSPFGGLNVTPARQLRRMFMSPGPIFDPQGHGAAWANFARPLHALGARPGHLIQNCYSYHFTPAAFMVEAAAAQLGCTVLPAGTGQTEMQAMAMARLKPEIYTGTPSFLKIILEFAQKAGADVSSLQYALVSGEALPPSLRTLLHNLGVRQVLQLYGMADLGCVAYETMSHGAVNPGMVVEESVLLEIVRPGTGEVLPDGEVGEVVVTNFDPTYPLIRFATGDLSAILPGHSPCGRTNMRIRGWLGRADQTTKVRGMFVYPGQIGEIVARHPWVQKARLVVSGDAGGDIMTLYCEAAHAVSDAQLADVALTIRDVTKLRGEVRNVAPGSLPGDGMLIEDGREYI